MNKKLLLGLLALAAAHSAAEAQSRRPTINRAATLKGVPMPQHLTANEQGPLRSTSAVQSRSPQAPQPASFGQLIGQTTYDLQSNRASPNRMAMTGNTLSAVWTQTCALSGGTFAKRGIGYNYSADANTPTVPGVSFVNGTTGNCPSDFGLSTVRVGWPEVAHVNGKELVVAHAGAGIVSMSRPVGTGAWTPSTPLTFSQAILGGAGNGTWPRLVASGNTAHMVYAGNGSTTNGVVSPMLYSRSLDGGANWDKQNVLLPGMDSTNFDYVGGDSYAIAVNGNTVAMAAGSFGDHTLVWKSTNNGDSFEAYTIQGDFTDADTVQIQGQTGDTAAVVASDGAMSVVVDNAGAIHWFSGSQLVQVVKDPISGKWIASGTYYPDAVRALLYWNDRELRFTSLRDVSIAGVDMLCPSAPAFTPCDLARADGTNQSRQPYNVIGPVSMPTAITDANGDVYVIYAAGRIGTSNTGAEDGQYLRDLYLQKLSFPGGNQVQVHQQKNISRDIKNIADGAAAANNEESAFPTAVHTVVNNKIHYQWMSDFEPGNALQPTAGPDPEVENAIMYDNIQLPLPFTPDFVITGTLGLRNDATDFVKVVSASPNPTTGKTTLSLNLKQAARATIVVRNVLGQEVLRLPAMALATGMNSVSLDLSNQGAGVYFYTVAADKFTVTQRVVKQ